MVIFSVLSDFSLKEAWQPICLHGPTHSAPHLSLIGYSGSKLKPLLLLVYSYRKSSLKLKMIILPEFSFLTGSFTSVAFSHHVFA